MTDRQTSTAHAHTGPTTHQSMYD